MEEATNIKLCYVFKLEILWHDTVTSITSSHSNMLSAKVPLCAAFYISLTVLLLKGRDHLGDLAMGGIY